MLGTPTLRRVRIGRIVDVVELPAGDSMKSTFSLDIDGTRVWSVQVVGSIVVGEDIDAIAAFRSSRDLRSIMGWIDVATGVVSGCGSDRGSVAAPIVQAGFVSAMAATALRALALPQPLRVGLVATSLIALGTLAIRSRADRRLERRLMSARGALISEARLAHPVTPHLEHAQAH